MLKKIKNNMSKIKCKNQDIIDYGATICLNSKDSSGNYVPDIIWEKECLEKNLTDYIAEDSDITFNTIVYRGPFTKKVSEFMIETNNFYKD